MSSLTDAIYEPLENLFDSVGMMQGEAAPLMRAGVGAALGYGVAYGLKPGFAFDENGNAKVWKLTNPDSSDSTWVPAWMVVAFPAVLFGVLI